MSAASLFLFTANVALACAFAPAAHVARPVAMRAAAAVTMSERDFDDETLEAYAAALAEEDVLPESPAEVYGSVDVTDAAEQIGSGFRAKRIELPTVDVDWTDVIAKAVVAAQGVADVVKTTTDTVKEAAEVNEATLEVQPAEAIEAVKDGATKAKEAAAAASDFAAEQDLGWKARAVFELVREGVVDMKAAQASSKKPAAKGGSGFSMPKMALPKPAKKPAAKKPAAKKPPAAKKRAPPAKPKPKAKPMAKKSANKKGAAAKPAGFKWEFPKF